MAVKIFINYRRGDDPRSTSALYKCLEQAFGDASILMDMEAYIEPGTGLARELAAHVEQCGVLLALIGPRWAERLAARACDPDDFVRIEIEAALAQGKPAIPVLVGGASLPPVETLPEAIRALVRKGAVNLRPDRFEQDCEGLIDALKRAFSGAGRERPRAEAERPGSQAARSAQPRPEQAPAGRTPAEIRGAEELEKWNLIKDSDDPEDFLDHLARFPGGPTERYARKRLEALQSEAARVANEAEGARFSEEGRRGENEAWAKVAKSTKIAELEAFLRAWPNGIYAGSAERRIRDLQDANKGERLALFIMLGIVALMIGLIAFAAVKF